MNCNAQMGVDHIKEFCTLDSLSKSLLKQACDTYGYSARVVHKMLRLARTSADLRASEHIDKRDIERVLSCRDFDRCASELLVVS